MNWKPLLPATALALIGSATLTASLQVSLQAAPTKKATVKKTAMKKPVNTAMNMAPLPIVLPKPAFVGTPKNISNTTAPKPSGKPRPAFLAPRGVMNLSKGRPATSSDAAPIIGTLDLLTDGDKNAVDGSWVELGPGRQHVQIDLGKSANIYAIVLWHYHAEGRIYRDVVAQVSDDADFISGVKTVYNNDQDNSSGLGIGKDKEFYELAEGKLIPAKGVKGRYVRLYSKGNTSDEQNQYTEVEVWGK